jgi:hypothetical protein
MDHPNITPKECPWRGIIIRVLYMFTKMDVVCPLISKKLNVRNVEEFRLWLSINPGDYGFLPFHNGLKLFLWIINIYRIKDDLAL